MNEFTKSLKLIIKGEIIMKKLVSLISLTLVCAVLFIGCTNSDKNVVDYSQYSFVDTSWTRETESDTETIRFGADGSFTYSCACGDSVNDSDLCEGYTYDDTTKTIALDCIETTDDMVTVIKIVKCNENELQLDFNGDLRIFTK